MRPSPFWLPSTAASRLKSSVRIHHSRTAARRSASDALLALRPALPAGCRAEGLLTRERPLAGRRLPLVCSPVLPPRRQCGSAAGAQLRAVQRAAAQDGIRSCRPA